eukprot:UN4000
MSTGGIPMAAFGLSSVEPCCRVSCRGRACACKAAVLIDALQWQLPWLLALAAMFVDTSLRLHLHLVQNLAGSPVRPCRVSQHILRMQCVLSRTPATEQHCPKEKRR